MVVSHADPGHLNFCHGRASPAHRRTHGAAMGGPDTPGHDVFRLGHDVFWLGHDVFRMGDDGIKMQGQRA